MNCEAIKRTLREGKNKLRKEVYEEVTKRKSEAIRKKRKRYRIVTNKTERGKREKTRGK